MVITSSDHLKRRQVFHEKRSIKYEVSSELWTSARQYFFFSGCSLLINTKNIEFTVLTEHEHASPCEGHLLNFGAFWETLNSEKLAQAVWVLFNFD